MTNTFSKQQSASAMKRIALAAMAASVSCSAVATETLSLWYHGAGNPAEMEVLGSIISDFNASQNDWAVEIQSFPQNSYNSSIVAAGLSDNLPDILDVDAPVMPNWAWSGYLAPLDIQEDQLAGFLPGTIGRYEGELYSIGFWDAAVAMFARRSVLEKHNIRIPTLESPWTKDEFNSALANLDASGDFKYPLDLGMASTGEWYSYAFGPFLHSFGGDLMDPSVPTAEGVLNGSAGIEFGEWWQMLFEQEWTPGTSQDGGDRETGFLNGDYALQWNGNWAAPAALAQFGDDLLLLPAPDMGEGSFIGSGSWQFAVTKSSDKQEGANAFIQFALKDKYVAAFSNTTGLIPATESAATMTSDYAAGGDLEVFYELSNEQARNRVITPGYGVASLEFEKALRDLANGADVADTLDAATDAINDDLEKNNGYR
ncbi:MAG: extracellular solute-binding protein [Saccharospirillum sp.]|uniref:sugar ABC transporter substrate-binding protein n=1 Tax=Saccharospirillum sp. TaxID=2033801 RepID=UPI0032976670